MCEEQKRNLTFQKHEPVSLKISAYNQNINVNFKCLYHIFFDQYVLCIFEEGDAFYFYLFCIFLILCKVTPRLKNLNKTSKLSSKTRHESSLLDLVCRNSIDLIYNNVYYLC